MKTFTTQRKRANAAKTLRMASGNASGFTLVEMLVAVGAVAFVAVGIASIFGSVGDTVSRGRSVSAITQYAAVLERQMREDFANMTREGYLVIRHEEADGGNPVPLFPGQSNPRSRRIDEIVFFTNEPTVSAREALVPGYVPEGSSARVYYGIGQRLTEDIDPASQYARPDITDRNRSGVEERLGAGTSLNPNRFAGGWTLLRHETALVVPGGGLGDDPGLPGIPQAQWRDNRLQIALQPAAESIFQSINLVDVSPCPGVFPSVDTVRTSVLGSGTSVDPDESPLFESGLIDVATTSLEEIRAIVQASPGVVAGGAADTFNYVSPIVLEGDCALFLGLSGQVGPVGVQQAWMLDGFPAPSNEFRLTFSPTDDTPIGEEVPSYTRVAVPDVEIARIRYEPEPPDVFTPLSLAATDPNESAIRLADQYALASSGFIPRVSEFIVEWSFGKLDDDGRLIWHGGAREIDIDNDGTPDEFVFPYPEYQADVRGTPRDRAGGFFVPYELIQPAVSGDARIGNQAIELNIPDPSLADAPVSFTNGDIADVGDRYASYPVYPEVIHGVDASGFTPPDTTTISYFGYTLPYFNPDDPDLDGNTNDAAVADTLAWPWPELVRVTVRLTDPGDETIERTFQYVFPTPGNPVR